MDFNNDIKIVAEGETLNMRTGDLPPIHQPTPFYESGVDIKGVIPFIRDRIKNEQIDKRNCIVKLNQKEGKATFISDMLQENKLTYKLSAEYKRKSNILTQNLEKSVQINDFRKLIARLRRFFTHDSEFEKLCKELERFNVNAHVKIGDSKNESQRDINKSYSNQIQSSVPEIVEMQFDDFKFGVYIIIAIKDSIANFWLESKELDDLVDKDIEHQIDLIRFFCIEQEISLVDI